jgi:hypothetical protein
MVLLGNHQRYEIIITSWPVDGKKSIWFLNEWGAASVAPDCESEVERLFVRLP